MRLCKSLVLCACLSASTAACDSETEAKATKKCGADPKARSDGSACAACCKANGVQSHQFDGMNQSCICR